MDAPLFDAFVEYESITFSQDEGTFPGVPLPPSLSRAVPRRRREFAAGRRCAHEALERLLGRCIVAPIGTGPLGAPLWPPGVVGSITHGHGFAAAVVARSTASAGLGIDSERIVSRALAEEIAPQIVTAAELEALDHDGLDPATLLTVVFSAKESVYKCLFPLVGRYFDFHDVHAARVHRGAGVFEVDLRTHLGPLACGTRLAGRFFFDGGLVHTGIALAGRSCHRGAPGLVGSPSPP